MGRRVYFDSATIWKVASLALEKSAVLTPRSTAHLGHI